MGVGESVNVGWDELFDCVSVPGTGCLVKLPCRVFFCAGFSGDPGSKSLRASCQAPFVAFVKESLDVVACCFCWLPFLPRHLDYRDGVVPVDGFNEDALLVGPAQDGVWHVQLAKGGLDPDEADDAFVGALCVLLPAPRVLYGCCRGGGERLDPVSQCFAGAFQCCDPFFVADVLLVEDDADCFSVFRGGGDGLLCAAEQGGFTLSLVDQFVEGTRWRTGLVPHWPGMLVVPVARRQMTQTALGVVLLNIAAAACPWSSSAHWLIARKGLASVCLLSDAAKSLYWVMGSDHSA